jgi:hypothetical protein
VRYSWQVELVKVLNNFRRVFSIFSLAVARDVEKERRSVGPFS